MKGVLVHKPHSPYDDHPPTRYHFPLQYLKTAEQLVGEGVLFYRPGEGFRRYEAAAEIAGIIPDPVARERRHFYALIRPGSFRAFATPVPARTGEGDYLNSLVEDTPRPSRRPLLRRAVRFIPDADFARVVELGGLDWD